MKCDICGLEFSSEVFPHHYKFCSEQAQVSEDGSNGTPNELEGIDLENLIDTDLESLTVKQLKAILTVKEVEFSDKDLKPALIEKLEAVIFE